MRLDTAAPMMIRSFHSMCQFQIFINDKMIVSCSYKLFFNEYLKKYKDFRCDTIIWHCHSSIYEIYLYKKGYKEEEDGSKSTL